MTILLGAFTLQAQKRVFIFVQDYRVEPTYSLYWNMKYGITTYLNNSDDYKFVERSSDNHYIKYYNKKLGLTISCFLSYGWTGSTKAFIEAVERDPAVTDSILYVIAGHNELLDWDSKVHSYNSYDNFLMGCYTENWEGVVNNTIISTTKMIAPECYSYMEAVEQWSKGSSHKSIIEAAISSYKKYQNTNNVFTLKY